MSDESRIRYHETNEGREVSQGLAGFEGTNVLLLIGAMGLSLILSQGVDNLGLPLWANIVIMAMPIVVVSAYVFGLKQGKPKSYDIELAEWLIIKIAKVNFFSPSQVEKVKLPWTEPLKKQELAAYAKKQSPLPAQSSLPPSDAQNH
jgi:hypothetical protein